MKQAGVRVNITPRSDTQWGIASGVFGYQQALDHDMKPAFSIDNESAYSGDMFTEMRVALALQRSAAQFRKYQGDTNAPKPVTMRQLLETATINGAFVAHLDDRTGSLSEGKEADIVLINTNDISLYPSNNALGSVVNAGERSNVETVIIGGRIRKWEGKLVGVDMERLRAATETSQEYLFKATRYVPDMFSEKFELKD
jgi:cytosine/adenosine deaminase-related metal-dependent hydrolase